MAEILLRGVESNKEKVIEMYSEITGVDLKEATRVIDSVEQGEIVTITGIDSLDIASIIEQFSNAGAIAILNNDTNVSDRSISESEFSDDYEKDVIIEDKLIKEIEEDTKLDITIVDIDDIVGTDRKAILSVLQDVLKISRYIDRIMEKIKQIENEIKEVKKQADNILNQMSPTGMKVWLGLTFGSMVFGFFTYPNRLRGAIVIGLMAGFLLWFGVKSIDDIIYAKQKQENKEKYLEENLFPKLNTQKKIDERAEEFLSSREVLWAIDVVGKEYFNTLVIQKIYDLISGRRADSLKEAINLYETIKYQEDMKDMQSSILELTETSAAAAKATAAAAKEQLEYAKQTEKNTKSAARTAKVNAVINYGAYKNVKDINKKLK